MNKWYETVDDTSDIFISSRIRFARNLKDFNFAPKLSDEAADQLIEKIKDVLPKMRELNSQKKYYSSDVSSLSELDRNAMMEKHIISPEFVAKKQHTGLILSEDESVSIMMNEEDHLKIQIVHSGMDLENALKEANAIDDLFSENFEFAFDEKLGYLTTCPTNVGTAMRASYMVFLPALTYSNRMPGLTEEVSKYGITIRGMYGENTQSMGCFYQISNMKTLGFTEKEIIENLNRLVAQIVGQEKKRRVYMLSSNYEELEDRVNRAYGILRYAKSIASKEAMELLADVKFGMDTGLIEPLQKTNLYPLMMAIRPSCLQWKLSKNIGKAMRDRTRADFIRNHLPEIEEETTTS